MPEFDVLAVGSAHLDILCETAADDLDARDAPGKVRFAAGGTAYNIAGNLGRAGCRTALYTHLNPTGFSGACVLADLRRTPVSERFVVLDDSLPESAFCARFAGGRFQHAVSSMAVEQARLDAKLLGEAVAASARIVVDCNLSAAQIAEVLAVAARHARPVAVACVSAAKAGRYRGALQPASWPALVAMNRFEFESLAGRPLDTTGLSADGILDGLRARAALISDGADGHLAVTASGLRRFPAPPAAHRHPAGTDLGAGDALVAAHCAAMDPAGTVDWDAAHDRFLALLPDILAAAAATPPAAY